MHSTGPKTKRSRGGLFTSADGRRAMVMPVAGIVSFLLSITMDADWWMLFGGTLSALYIAEWAWSWFTAPEEEMARHGAGPPEMIVPRDAKLAPIAAAGIIAAIVLLIWII